jgi:MT0933-like antitoxin protein
MGLGDKFKNIAKQAQDAVVEHKDQLHDAVDAAGVVADRKTRGKHTAKIAKFGQKAGDAIDRLGGDEQQDEAAAGGEGGSARESGPAPGSGPPPGAA